nr:hypothetical protein [Tanacetum cinerariifolium]
IFNAHNDYLDSQIKLNSTLAKLTEQMTSFTLFFEMACQIFQKKQEEKQLEEEQAAKAQNWKLPICYDDDDDEERSNSLKDNIISGLPPCSAITPNEPVLSTEEPDNSLSVGDEHPDTIPAMESDEFIKSSVENLIPIPKGDILLLEAFLNDDHSSDFKTKSSSTSLNSLLEETNNFDNSLPEFTTFSNVLFEAEYEFDSSDDQSCSDEDVLEKIFSKPLFEEEIILMKIDPHPDNAEYDLMESLRTHDSSLLISSKIDSLLDEFAGEITLLKSIPPGIDETDCDFEGDTDSDSLMEEIDLFYTSDYPMSPGIEDDDYDSERDILILKDLPSNNTLHLGKKSHSILIFLLTPTEPIDSLIMGDEHLDTIPATESDEFIKSCVKNLVPNPSESKGENGCDVPAGFTTFSNVLFDDDYDSDSSDDQSLSNEDVSEKIYSNPLLDEEIIPMEIDHHSFNAESDLIESMPNHDSSIIISSKIDSLFDENSFTKRLLYNNSSPRPPEEIVSDISNADIESFSPSPIPNKDSDPLIEEIDLNFNPDDPMPSSIEEDDDDSERDILILEELLDNYSLSLPTNESYHFDIPSPYRPPAKPLDGNTGTLNIKMLGDVSDQMPSAEFPMIINGKNIPLSDVPLFHFYPLDQLKYGGN